MNTCNLILKIMMTRIWLDMEVGISFLELCPMEFLVQHQLKVQNKGRIWVLLLAESCGFQWHCIMDHWITLIVKFGLQGLFGIALLYQWPCCIAASLLELLDSLAGLTITFPRNNLGRVWYVFPRCKIGESSWLRSSWSRSLRTWPVAIVICWKPPSPEQSWCDLDIVGININLLSWSYLSLCWISPMWSSAAAR